MPLVDTEIRKAIDSGAWKATRGGQPITADELTIGPNSINLSLAALIVQIIPRMGNPIDLHDEVSFRQINHRCEKGFVLEPGKLYLAACREAFDCSAPLEIEQRVRVRGVGSPLGQVETRFVQCVEGRSTVARVGLSTHASAGFGDYGFSAPFTLELTVALPLRVHEGDEIAQVFFLPLSGEVTTPYVGAYVGQTGPTPARLGKGRFQR